MRHAGTRRAGAAGLLFGIAAAVSTGSTGLAVAPGPTGAPGAAYRWGGSGPSGHIAVFSDAVAIQAGAGGQAVALKRDGKVYSQGNIPWAIPKKVVAMSLGYHHYMALDSEGTIWTWGGNRLGQLGDGTRVDNPNPRPLEKGQLEDLTPDDEEPEPLLEGRLEDLTPGDEEPPAAEPPADPPPLRALPKFTAIDAGPEHNLALSEDGKVFAWGLNNQGQSDGTTTSAELVEVLVPTWIADVPPSKAISAGAGHSLAVTLEGTVSGWGSNLEGQLGGGERPVPSAHPAKAIGPVRIVDVAAGEQHSLALAETGEVWAWGLDDTGQLGDGTPTPANNNPAVPEPLPIKVANVGGVRAIAAGNKYSVALSDGNRIFAWGQNTQGQLGYETPGAFSANASQVQLPPGIQGRATSISASFQEDTARTYALFVSDADLSVDKSGPPEAILGDEITYAIAAANSGPGPAYNLTILDTLPPGLEFLSASVNGRSDCAHDPVGRKVICTVGELGRGMAAHMDLKVKAVLPGRLVNQASVTSVSPEPAPALGDNTDTAVTQVRLAGLALPPFDLPLDLPENSPFDPPVDGAPPGSPRGPESHLPGSVASNPNNAAPIAPGGPGSPLLPGSGPAAGPGSAAQSVLATSTSSAVTAAGQAGSPIRIVQTATLMALGLSMETEGEARPAASSSYLHMVGRAPGSEGSNVDVGFAAALVAICCTCFGARLRRGDHHEHPSPQPGWAR